MKPRDDSCRSADRRNRLAADSEILTKLRESTLLSWFSQLRDNKLANGTDAR